MSFDTYVLLSAWNRKSFGHNRNRIDLHERSLRQCRHLDTTPRRFFRKVLCINLVEGGKVVKEIKAEALENAGGLVTEFYSGTPELLIPVLNAKGLTTTFDSKTGIVYAKGYYNLTNVVLAANEAGANIARVVTKETDLETYFVNLVGGESNA